MSVWSINSDAEQEKSVGSSFLKTVSEIIGCANISFEKKVPKLIRPWPQHCHTIKHNYFSTSMSKYTKVLTAKDDRDSLIGTPNHK